MSGLRLLVGCFGLSWLGFVSRRIGYLCVFGCGFDSLVVCLWVYWMFNSVGQCAFYFEL